MFSSTIILVEWDFSRIVIQMIWNQIQLNSLLFLCGK